MTRRLAEELALANDLPPGPVRDAWMEGLTRRAWRGMSDAIRWSQQGLAAARDHRWDEALEAFQAAGYAAWAIEPVVEVLEPEKGREAA